VKRPVLTAWSVVIVLLALLLPATVAAAKPIREVGAFTGLSCDVATDDGFVSMFVEIGSDGDGFGDLAFWESPAEPFESEPTLITVAVDFSGGATGIDATFELVEFDPSSEPPFGDPAGTAVLDATLTPDGDPVPFEDEFHDGNVHGRIEGWSQELTVAGTLTLPGADLTDLSGCFAFHEESTAFVTNPSAFNAKFSEGNLFCFWEDEDSIVELNGFQDRFNTFLDVRVSSETGGASAGLDVDLDDGAFEFETPLFDEEDGSEVGSASGGATLTPDGDEIRILEVNGRSRLKLIIQEFSVAGELEIELGGVTTTYPMDDEHCAAQVVEGHRVDVRPAGPKPRPYPNEGPGQAIPLVLGTPVTLKTGAGAEAPEATCLFDDFEEIPIGHTAWWSVVGTGGELTADTAGSDFDTVLGVYVQDGSDLVQVGCIDDVDILQAVITWDSEAGVTYLIQAGGFGGSTGNLVLVVR
jgi:hypothetical protein